MKAFLGSFSDKRLPATVLGLAANFANIFLPDIHRALLLFSFFQPVELNSRIKETSLYFLSSSRPSRY